MMVKTIMFAMDLSAFSRSSSAVNAAICYLNSDSQLYLSLFTSQYVFLLVLLESTLSIS